MTTDADDAAKIAELDQTVTRLRKDLLSSRDALIGAQAEAATLKVRNREIEVRVAQVEHALATQTRIVRGLERFTNHRLTRGAARRMRQLTG